MRLGLAFTALIALAACGVDGAPIPPGSQDELAPARNETPTTGGPIGGFSSVHAGAVL